MRPLLVMVVFKVLKEPLVRSRLPLWAVFFGGAGCMLVSMWVVP